MAITPEVIMNHKDEGQFQLVLIYPNDAFVNREAAEAEHPNANVAFFAKDAWYLVYDIDY